MAANFFRKAALEKLSSPEKLDQLIKVTGPRAWIGLLAITLILLTGVGWAFLGSVKTKLNAVGVLLGGEVHEIVSTSQGQLISFKVNIGDAIDEGDVIAIVEQRQLLQQIDEVKALLTEQKYELKQLLSFGSQDTRLQGEFILQQRVSIKLQIETTEKNLKFLQNQLVTEKELFDKGLITLSQVVNTEQQIEGARNQIESLKAQLAQASSQELNLNYDLKQRMTLMNQRIAQSERNLEQLLERYDIQTNIRSPHGGEVVELLSDAGTVVMQGTPLFKIKDQEGARTADLKGMLYVPSQEGKKIKVGMEVLVVPSTVQPQEFGFMKGSVTYVSEFPITQQGMLTSVKNPQLVQGLLAMGAPFEVHVNFEKDSESFSGYRWTSAKGPEVTINAGTACMGKITVKEEQPATIVVPALKKFFDLY
jgi:HlyD family secretion protein